VKWGIFPLPPTRKVSHDSYDDDYENDENDAEDIQEMEVLETQHLICAGDLIVQVAETPTPSMEALRSMLASIPIGTKVLVRVLRKSTPLVRCPMGHMLRLDDPRANLEAECDSCRSNFGRHHCVQCGFSLCWPCFQLIYAHSKARFPQPVNNDHEFTEAPRSSVLSFSPADVGVNVIIYWFTTAEWWIGQIESFDHLKGHTVVYEERNGKKCKEIIPDFSVREYRILTHCVLGDTPRAEQTPYAQTQSATPDFLQDDGEEEKSADLLGLGDSTPQRSSLFDDSAAEQQATPLISLVSHGYYPQANQEDPLLDNQIEPSATLIGLPASTAATSTSESRLQMMEQTQTQAETPPSWDLSSLSITTGETPTVEPEVAPNADDKVILDEDEAELLKGIMGDVDIDDDDDAAKLQGPP
jgi:hypothetical protein